MTGAGTSGVRTRRRAPPLWSILLVALALSLKVLIPTGFMVSPQTAGATLVICTGRGAMLARPSKPDHDRAPAKAGDTCPFAANITPPAPPPAMILGAPARIDYATVANPHPVSALLPGRGLAAPPPPSLGPPALLS